MVRGEGCHVWDEHGNRYFDGLSALFCVNIGHGRADIAQAGADQAKELGFFTNWSYAHPPAIELAAKIASLAPGRPQPRLLHQRRLARPWRRAIKLGAPVPQAHAATRTRRRSSRARPPTTARRWARSPRPASPACARRSSRFTPGGCHVPNTNLYRLAQGIRRREPRRVDRQADRVRGPGAPSPRSSSSRCRTRAAASCRRRATSSACARSATSTTSCFVSDEVICSWGRLGEWFGAQRYDYQPDIITTAKGIT